MSKKKEITQYDLNEKLLDIEHNIEHTNKKVFAIGQVQDDFIKPIHSNTKRTYEMVAVLDDKVHLLTQKLIIISEQLTILIEKSNQ